MHVVFPGFLKDMRDLVFFGCHLFQAVQLGTHLSDLFLRLLPHRFLDVLPLDFQSFGFVVEELINGIILIFDRVLPLSIGIHDLLRNQRMLAGAGVLKNPRDGIVILDRNGIKLVIVTSGAGRGESQEGAGKGIHAI